MKLLKFKTYFSDFFEIESKQIEDHGAFNISLLNDLPLFIDPFLLFNSEKEEYQKLHEDIIDYLLFLKSISSENLSKGDIDNYFKFPETKQTWFGYSKTGNGGNGLGKKFANGLTESFRKYLSNFGKEINTSSHLEKACLFDTGIGKDNISDFTTNLIVGYLAEYTQKFSNKNINEKFLEDFRIEKYEFNYQTSSWISKIFKLPFILNGKGKKEFVLMTPKDILTKDDPWINNRDKFNQFHIILKTIPNEQLRSQINRYFNSILKKDKNHKVSKKDKDIAKLQTYQQYPELIDLFIKNREENGDKAVAVSSKLVELTKSIFEDLAKEIVKLLSGTEFYKQKSDSFEDTYRRLLYFKDCVENKWFWKLFYNKQREITNESELQLLFKLTHFDSEFDYNAEPDNGTGSVDFTSSMGSKDKAIIEFKLARNSKFKQNAHPLGQVKAYEKSNNTKKSIKVFFCFNKKEVQKVEKFIKDYKLNEKQIVIINCSTQVSASNINPFKFDSWDLKKMADL